MKIDTRSRTSIECSPNVFLVKNPACPNEADNEMSSDRRGRERLYNTVIVTTPVLGSSRIYTNQTNSGVKKRLYSQDEMTDLVDQFNSLTVGKSKREESVTQFQSPSKDRKTMMTQASSPFQSPLKDRTTMTEKCNSSSNSNIGLNTKTATIKTEFDMDRDVPFDTNKSFIPIKIGSSDTRLDSATSKPNQDEPPIKNCQSKNSNANEGSRLGFLEQSIFSSKFKQVVPVKRSARLMNKNEHHRGI